MIKLYNQDCIEQMDRLADEDIKVDMVLTDPPFGVTAQEWDTIIPFKDMWISLKMSEENSMCMCCIK